MTVLTSDCLRFVNRLCSHPAPNGGYLSLRVAEAWTIAETSGGNSGVRGYNMLNIGNTDSSPFGGPRWSSPEEAADATFAWLVHNPASGASILGAWGKSDAEQLAGIYNSPFASSRYRAQDAAGNWVGPNGVRLQAAYASLPDAVQPAIPNAEVAVPAPTPEEEYMQATHAPSGRTYVASPGGDVLGPFGPDGRPTTGFLGSISGHPDWNAGAGKANGPVKAIVLTDDVAAGKVPADKSQGPSYTLVTQDAGGALHYYDFPSDGSLAK